MSRYSFFLLLCLALALAGVDSCGVTQHNAIAHKAMGWFGNNNITKGFLPILQQQQGAFQNGAAFPDWG